MASLRIACRTRSNRSYVATGRRGFCSRCNLTPRSGFSASIHSPFGSFTLVAQISMVRRKTKSAWTVRRLTRPCRPERLAAGQCDLKGTIGYLSDAPALMTLDQEILALPTISGIMNVEGYLVRVGPFAEAQAATVSATVSPGKSEHFRAGKRPPMLGK